MDTPEFFSLSRARVELAIPDKKPLFSSTEARAEAERCLYCVDAPCIKACPTEIDIPTFIRRIGTGDSVGSASRSRPFGRIRRGVYRRWARRRHAIGGPGRGGRWRHVFSGGDCVNGGQEVVNAVAEGRNAARELLKQWASSVELDMAI